MSEQTVSDERIKRLAEICTDPPERLFPWVYKLAGRANDIAAICRELLARREADRLAEKGTDRTVAERLGTEG